MKKTKLLGPIRNLYAIVTFRHSLLPSEDAGWKQTTLQILPCPCRAPGSQGSRTEDWPTRGCAVRLSLPFRPSGGEARSSQLLRTKDKKIHCEFASFRRKAAATWTMTVTISQGKRWGSLEKASAVCLSGVRPPAIDKCNLYMQSRHGSSMSSRNSPKQPLGKRMSD